jgi:hypothetical protein
VGFIAHQMFDAVLYVGQMGLFYWIMLGLMASLSKMVSSGKPAEVHKAAALA